MGKIEKKPHAKDTQFRICWMALRSLKGTRPLVIGYVSMSLFFCSSYTSFFDFDSPENGSLG